MTEQEQEGQYGVGDTILIIIIILLLICLIAESSFVFGVYYGIYHVK